MIIEKLIDNDIKKRQVEFIKKVVASYFGVDEHLCFNTKKRQRELLTAKHVAIYFVSIKQKISSVDLGKLFNCDHATVLHIIKKINNYLDWDKTFKQQVDEIDKILQYKSLNASPLDIDKEFYFIDLNQFKSIKHSTGKSIILVGFNDEQVKNMQFIDENNCDWFTNKKVVVEHKDTGMYILERRKNENN